MNVKENPISPVLSQFALPESVCEILNMLQNAGYEAYIVGGCVRDLLLYNGMVLPNDWDIATSATPAESMEIFKTYRVIPTGLKHGTISILLDGVSYELTTFRIDGEYQNARSPESVSLTRSLAEDVIRRDFTINALAYSPRTGLVDLVGGLEDLSKRQITCVGEASQRFREDSLRILRALRFASTLGFEIQVDTKQALFEACGGLRQISSERVRVELEKLLCGKYALEVLREFGRVVSVVLPEIVPFLESQAWERTLLVVRYSPQVPLLRWVALLYAIDMRVYERDSQVKKTSVESLLRGLRFDNKSIVKICELIVQIDMPLGDSVIEILRGLRDFGEEFLRDWLALQRARQMARDYSCVQALESSTGLFDRIEKNLDEILKARLPFSLKHLALNGRDLQSIGVKNGKIIGQILNELLNQVMVGDVENTRSELLGKAQELYQEIRLDR